MQQSDETVPVYIDFLNRFDIESLQITDSELLSAVENGLEFQGKAQVSIEPRTHIEPANDVDGHFNVLRGWIGGSINLAGTKVVGDFVENYQDNRPSEYGVLTLFDPENGAPTAILDAAGITDMRTGAITALGAKYLAPQEPKVLAHIGARGTAYWNIRLLSNLFDFDEIRVHSRRESSRQGFVDRLNDDPLIGLCTVDRHGRRPVIKATDNWKDCIEGADIVVEASRLNEPEPLLSSQWIRPGALLIPYGTMSALDDQLPGIVDKFVMDDWGQAFGKFGALRRFIDNGEFNAENLHAELGEIVAGKKPGRERNSETILFWHRGLSLSDIALGHAMLEKAVRMGIGQRLRFY